MTAKVILNPYAGRWLAQQRMPEAKTALADAGIPFDMVVTERPGHGTDLAYQACREGFTPIISAGGDGSISEVVNGIARAIQDSSIPGEPPPLGILPLGSANDLVVNLGLPKDLGEAARVIASGKTRKMDLGVVRHDNHPQPQYFDNNSAIGLEPSITLVQQRITWLRGTLRYLVSTLIGIVQGPRWEAILEWDGGMYDGPLTLVTVGNNALTGGLFYMTPHANPFDGRLTFVYGNIPSRLQILSILPRTMKPGAGSYVEDPAIHEIHSTWLKIKMKNPTPLHADGEIQSGAAMEIDYSVLPGILPILVV